MFRLSRTSIAVPALLAELIIAHAQTPGVASPDANQRPPAVNEIQPKGGGNDTTGSAPRQQRELNRDNPARSDGDTDRAPPSKLDPGEPPTPQNSKAQ
jgi:hypothetical protein